MREMMRYFGNISAIARAHAHYYVSRCAAHASAMMRKIHMILGMPKKPSLSLLIARHSIASLIGLKTPPTTNGMSIIFSSDITKLRSDTFYDAFALPFMQATLL